MRYMPDVCVMMGILGDVCSLFACFLIFTPLYSYQYVHTAMYFLPDDNIVTLYILENKLQGMEASASRT